MSQAAATLNRLALPATRNTAAAALRCASTRAIVTAAAAPLRQHSPSALTAQRKPTHTTATVRAAAGAAQATMTQVCDQLLELSVAIVPA